MPENKVQLRLLTVEFLRPGPAHNQLLSPLTPYLAICGDSEAGVVTIPYEHARFEWRLKTLRYGGSGDNGDRQNMLNEIGADMGAILGAVPGLAGALTNDPRQPGRMVHLRLIVSASELALLPFELAKKPLGPNASGGTWLAVEMRPPVCITRNVRTVSPEGVLWPDTPRILFIAGDTDTTPYRQHRVALLKAIEPFLYPEKKNEVNTTRPAWAASASLQREQYGGLLTILMNPTVQDIDRECRDIRYTHIHILSHGDAYGASNDEYGLVLKDRDGSLDVVSGERFASAITTLTDEGIHRPTVITLGSCDSGNVGSVVLPGGASLAHALHQSGIPLVIASQFPLSKEGSVPLAATLYEDLLWGKHPLVPLQRLRAELHASFTATWHDWASLVVYEALPLSLDDQLDSLRYWQARRAINAALERVDQAVKPRNDTSNGSTQTTPDTPPLSLDQLIDLVERRMERLPLDGHYRMECLGLRASARKRLAQATQTMPDDTQQTASKPRDPYDLLDAACRDYDAAMRGFMTNEAHAVQRMATLHWVLVQVVSINVVLGRPWNEGAWQAARLAAELYTGNSNIEECAWAHGSLAELWLLALAPLPPDDPRRQDCRREAVKAAKEIVKLYPGRDTFPVTSTSRQFERYIDWWGSDAFAAGLQRRNQMPHPGWAGANGIKAIAAELVRELRPKAPAPKEPPPGTAPGTAGPGTSSGTASPTASSAPQSPSPAAPSAAAGDTSSGVLSARSTRKGRFFDITLLPAGHGDCLWIDYGENDDARRWLIDCGTLKTAQELLRRFAALPDQQRRLELFVMTHIDDDHLGGALPIFNAVKTGLTFGDVWFNGWRHVSGVLGAQKAEMFSTAIQDFGLPWNVWRDRGPIVVSGGTLPTCTMPGGMKVTLLSPTPAELKKLAPAWRRELKRYGLEPGARVDYGKFLAGAPPSTSTDVDALADVPFKADSGAPNGSSIAFLAEFGDTACLFGADAHAPVLVESIRTLLRQRGTPRLKVDAFKVSHHGSQYNVSRELLELLDCPRYFISTNGDHFFHPDREAIARIIKYGGPKPSLYFNYRTQYNEVWDRADLQERYHYQTHYPDQQSAVAISLI